MPTIKGGIKFGNSMSDEDLEKFAKVTGRIVTAKRGVPVEQPKVKKAPVKKKVVSKKKAVK
jgi:hypothetical protein